ncbi:UDP-N-acetylmuramate dehydrogenase [Anaerobiospirillum sp. NML120449]|uniref:UDP-N-acetylmuramate dehydrogenase n=1 Tax=Anaerobiospirillum sp. NML120449 TaxID=2932817 RepID=UPI001FF43D8C|nr:UDP-N-acetylmuramate dehydrogenase [Anaerobiospirillum sp. NML120449]MCK0527485.1 UDP-N-acetylmuramate dehydrogenase [Anaerobiospirillum sp. NML120449]
MFDLRNYNTFNLTVYAREGREVHSIDDLKTPVTGPYIILGGGSDVLFTEDFDGTVLINKIEGVSIEKCSDCYLVRAGGGLVLDDFIEQMLSQDITGLENLSLIPGTVGAAPIQNVGAYGVEVGSLIESVEAVNLNDGSLRIFTHDECAFAYRHSIFKEPQCRSYFITHVTFRLPLAFTPVQNYAGLQSCSFRDAGAVRNTVIALRNEKLPNPRHVGNAGCFFKNPYVQPEVLHALEKSFGKVPSWPAEDGSCKLAAGWLIDKAGCRGIRHGQVGTWGQQALVIVNLGDALPHEVLAMARYVSAEVKSKFSIDLVPEVRLYGKHGEREWEQI